MKTCTGCGESLELDEFGADKRTKDGLSPMCWSCRSVARPGATKKRCVMCDELKYLAEFPRNLQAVDGLRTVCKPCAVRTARSWLKLNKEKYDANLRAWTGAHKEMLRSPRRRHHLKKTYGLTEEQYWELFDLQGRVCAVCGSRPRTKNLHVDHDHKTGEVRGLLCTSCNTKLMPFIEHHPEYAEYAREYLDSPPARELLR